MSEVRLGLRRTIKSDKYGIRIYGEDGRFIVAFPYPETEVDRVARENREMKPGYWED